MNLEKIESALESECWETARRLAVDALKIDNKSIDLNLEKQKRSNDVVFS